MTRDVVVRLMARGEECARDVGRGGFAGFMAGVQHGLEIARREPAIVEPLSEELRAQLARAATPDEIAYAAHETDQAITAILREGHVT